MRPLIVVCLLCISLIFSIPCCAEALKSESLKIGAIFGFTGPASTWSAQARRGIDLAVEEHNRESNSAKFKLEIIYEDSSSTPAGAVSAFNKLMQVDKVKVVVGDIFSYLTLPLVPLAQRHKVLLITPSIFDTDMPKNSEFFYSTCPRKESMRKSIDKFFEVNVDIRKLAIICANNTWGLTYLDVWKKSAAAHNVQVVDENCVDVSNYNTDMRSEVLRAKSKNPDALIAPFGIDRVIARAHELKFKPKVLSTVDVVDALLLRSMPRPAALGIFYNDWLASDIFRDNFSKRFSTAPIMEPQNSYEAVRAIAKAFELNSQDLEAGLKQVKYQGVAGLIDFTKDHVGNFGEATLMKVGPDKFLELN